eukprot:scaffold51741_cov38-Attheya_sp.AAC.1
MQWIKEHQDSMPGVSSNLDLWARLNVEMDLLAKQRRALHDRNPLQTDAQQHIEGETWRVFLNGIKVSNNLKSRLYEHCSGPALLEYWKTCRLGGLDHRFVH